MTRTVIALALCLAPRTFAASVPVRLEDLRGWWTYTVPAAHIRIELHVAHAERSQYDPFVQTTGRTLEGNHLSAGQWGHDPVQVLITNGHIVIAGEPYDVTGPCFTFPTTAPRRKQGQHWLIPDVAYEAVCGSGQRYWAEARKGRRCR